MNILSNICNSISFTRTAGAASFACVFVVYYYAYFFFTNILLH